MKCALVIGHDSENQGAINNFSEITEWRFNRLLSYEITKRAKGSEIVVVNRDVDGYNELPEKINDLNPDFIISLHCNAHDCTVSGSEVLQWYNSENGTRLATIAQSKINAALRNRNRGVKLVKREEERGGHLLKNTNAPCIMVEPFFIDNTEDLLNAFRNYKELATAIARTIIEYSRG